MNTNETTVNRIAHCRAGTSGNPGTISKNAEAVPLTVFFPSFWPYYLQRVICPCLEGKEMRYFVNENCIGCGRCAMVCPQIFEMTDEGVAKAADVPTEPTEDSEDARTGCPVDAIEKV